MHAGQFLKNLSLPDSFGRFWGQFLQGLPDSFGIFWDNFYRACQTVLEYFGTIFTGPARRTDRVRNVSMMLKSNLIAKFFAYNTPKGVQRLCREIFYSIFLLFLFALNDFKTQ
jgi:hypothetical protein